MILTVDEAHKIITEFVSRYPVADLELAYKVRNTLAELYGPFVSDLQSGLKAGYIPKKIAHDNGITFNGSIHITLENHRDRNDLVESLQHEIFGHFGVNTFRIEERNAFLDAVIVNRNEPSLKPLWEAVAKVYFDKSAEEQAEEVFARQCECLDLSSQIENTRDENVLKAIKNSGVRSFLETCINRTRPMRQLDLFNIARMVALGLQDGSRTQQHFPQYHSQLAVNPTKRKRKSNNRDFER